jgi:hypothetical protein
VEFSFQALEEAAAGFARIEHFLERAAAVLGGVPAVGLPLPVFLIAPRREELPAIDFLRVSRQFLCDTPVRRPTR